MTQENPDMVKGLFQQKRCMLYDFNGTLSEDELFLERSYDDSLERLGYSKLSADEYAQVLGLSEPEIAAKLLGNRGIHDLGEVSRLLDALSLAYSKFAMQQQFVSSSAVELILKLTEIGYGQAIVTGTLRSLIAPVLKGVGLGFLLDQTITIEDVLAGKPSPEGYCLALERVGVSANDAVIFEDSKAGVEAAKALGVEVIGIGPAVAKDPALLAHFPRFHDFARVALSSLSD